MSQGLQRRAPMWAALAVAAALLTPGAARADLVTYSTSGPTTTTLTVPGIQSQSADVITFKSQGSTTVNSTPADIQLGKFTWQQTSSGFLGLGTDTTGFNLTVTQTAPPPTQSGTYNGDLSTTFYFGFLGFGYSGDPDLTFSNTSIQIGNETYALELTTGPNSYSLVTATQASQGIDIPFGSDGLTLYAHLTSVPEPSTVPIVLLGAMAGAGAWYRRRRSA